MIDIARTYAFAAVGVALFKLVDLPLPWLLGPIAACLVAALAGLPLARAKGLGDGMRAVLGVAVGATLTVGVVASLPSMAASLAMIPLLILGSGVFGVWWLRRVWGFDPATSYYGAMPGGLQDMLAFGEEAGGDLRALALIHATRVVAIVMALPFLLEFGWGVDLAVAAGAPAREIGAAQLAIMAAAGLVGLVVAKRLGLFGASILGPMIAAGALSLLGILAHRPPAEAIAAAQFVIGASVGASYSGVTAEEVRRDVAAALGLCVILVVLAAIFTEAAILFDLAPPLDALLAFAPGGQAEMAILALIAGADVAFVVAHHLFRLVLVIVGAPIAARLMAAKPPG